MPDSNFVNALSDAGVGIAALIVLLAVIVVMGYAVKVIGKALSDLSEALVKLSASVTAHTEKLQALRDDVDRQGHTIETLEDRLSRMPQDFRMESTRGFDQILDTIERRWPRQDKSA